jgi:hypothetical protein
MACRDSSTDFLRSLGYTAIRLPRTKINPLDLVGKLPGGGNAKQLGPLTELVVSTGQSPTVTTDEQATDLTGKKTDKLDIGLGLNLLTGVIQALGVASGALNVAFGNSRQIEFYYEDVRSDSVEPVALMNYLGTHPSLDYNNPAVGQYFLGDGEVVVVTRTLKSHTFSVAAYDQHGQKVGINVNLLRQNLAQTGFDASEGAESKVSFKGNKDLVFAFQGYLLHVDPQGLHFADNIPDELGIFSVGAGQPSPGKPVVFSRQGLLNLD